MACLALFTVLSLLQISVVYPAPMINASWGQLSGIDLTHSGRLFYGYLGIPYALPPLGERRFAKPQPHPGPRAGRVFNASSKGPACPQQDALTEQSEDCLTLDVYIPSYIQGCSSTWPHPAVMVWIHGGGFTGGDAVRYTPGQLVTEGDVLVVIIQYRLGVLGFLSSGDDAASGNWGLMDQNLALQWIKDNIWAFSRCYMHTFTIFGQSAGGASVAYQLLSPMSLGLFDAAILQSGTPLSQWALNKTPRQAMYTLANLTGCARPADLEPPRWVLWFGQYLSPEYLEFWRRRLHARIVRCLRGVDKAKLVENTFLHVEGEGVNLKMFPRSPFVPTVDGEFVPRDPADLIHDSEYLSANGVTAINVMIGVNNNEAKPWAEFVYAQAKGLMSVIKSDEFVNSFIKDELEFQYGGQLAGNEAALSALAECANVFYTQPRVNGEIDLQDVVDLSSDVYFVVPAIAFARSLAEAKDKVRTSRPSEDIGGTYFYLFDHYPSFAKDDLLKGTGHALDVSYEFDPNPPAISREGFLYEDDELSRTFVSMVTGFAKYGFPYQPDAFLLHWPNFSATRESYLALAPQPRVKTDLYAKRVAFWLDLVPTLVNYTRHGLDHMTQATCSSEPME